MDAMYAVYFNITVLDQAPSMSAKMVLRSEECNSRRIKGWRLGVY
jgi:hypothetical protein